MKARDIRNTVWITTDVHFSEILRYTPFADDPSFRVHEAVVGPLNAGIFPDSRPRLDTEPRGLFFLGPDRAEDVVTWEQAKHRFNFGTLEVDTDGTLTIGVVNTAGERVFSLAVPAQQPTGERGVERERVRAGFAGSD
jgi:alkaline phosphatase D